MWGLEVHDFIRFLFRANRLAIFAVIEKKGKTERDENDRSKMV